MVVDQQKTHYYQPGFLFVPFDIYQPKDVIKPIDDFLPKRAQKIMEEIDRVEPSSNKVLLQNGQVLGYDILIIATGSQIAPEEVDGMMSENWYENVFDFYTYEGACALRKKLQNWEAESWWFTLLKCP